MREFTQLYRDDREALKVLPQLCHAIQELFPAKFTLRRCPELPGHHQDAHAGWIQCEIITELLDPINADFILILGVCGRRLKKK